MPLLSFLDKIMAEKEQEDFTHYISFKHSDTGEVIEFENLSQQATDDYNLLKPENMSEQDYTEHKLDCTDIILAGLVK